MQSSKDQVKATVLVAAVGGCAGLLLLCAYSFLEALIWASHYKHIFESANWNSSRMPYVSHGLMLVDVARPVYLRGMFLMFQVSFLQNCCLWFWIAATLALALGPVWQRMLSQDPNSKKPHLALWFLWCLFLATFVIIGVPLWSDVWPDSSWEWFNL